MINLLADEIDGIEKELLNNTNIFTIKKSFKDILFVDSFDNLNKVKIIIDEGCEVLLLEKDASKGNVEYCLKNGSILRHNLLILNSGNNSLRKLNLSENAIWDAVCADFSNNSSNFKIQCYLNENNAKGSFKLSALSKQKSNKIIDVNFTHNNINTESKMENYGVCRDASSLSFVGSSHIKKGSKKSVANQITKIMVFDSKCKASASPILKIDENDVIASHGASEGKINESHLFYLMSRGIDEETSKKIITLGYLNPILPLIFDEESRKDVEKAILERV